MRRESQHSGSAGEGATAAGTDARDYEHVQPTPEPPCQAELHGRGPAGAREDVHLVAVGSGPARPTPPATVGHGQRDDCDGPFTAGPPQLLAVPRRSGGIRLLHLDGRWDGPHLGGMFGQDAGGVPTACGTGPAWLHEHVEAARTVSPAPEATKEPGSGAATGSASEVAKEAAEGPATATARRGTKVAALRGTEGPALRGTEVAALRGTEGPAPRDTEETHAETAAAELARLLLGLSAHLLGRVPRPARQGETVRKNLGRPDLGVDDHIVRIHGRPPGDQVMGGARRTETPGAHHVVHAEFDRIPTTVDRPAVAAGGATGSCRPPRRAEPGPIDRQITAFPSPSGCTAERR